ncbi:MAG: glycosyltransferase, partial [Ignavibacteriae bacterium]|nr:glycosyltransferase [Ignavibacteriota bacterium]
MKKILYFTPYPSPFQIEFIEHCKTIAKNTEYSLNYYFFENLPNERQHWNVNSKIEILKSKTSILELLNNSNPSIIIITQYRGKYSKFIKNWAKKNSIAIFLGPIEPLRIDHLNLFKRILREVYLINFLKGFNGIAVMGKYAVIDYRRYFKGPIIDCFYSFQLRDLLSQQTKDIKNITDEIVFLYSGRLIHERNPLDNIRLFHRMVKNNPDKNLKLIISGDGYLKESVLSLIES